jgi:hypothetical protein
MFRAHVRVADESNVFDVLHAHHADDAAVVAITVKPDALADFGKELGDGMYVSCQRSGGITPL